MSGSVTPDIGNWRPDLRLESVLSFLNRRGFPRASICDSSCWLERRSAAMARAYSNDLRERVARSVLSGRSVRETAALFGVSVASAVKWSQRLRETGSAASRPVGGRRPRILAAEQSWLLAR